MSVPHASLRHFGPATNDPIADVYTATVGSYPNQMLNDRLQRLLRLCSIAFWIGFAIIMFRASQGLDVPFWIWPLGLFLVACEFIGWSRDKRARQLSDGS